MINPERKHPGIALPVISGDGEFALPIAGRRAPTGPIRTVALIRPATVLPEMTYTTVVGAPSLALAYLSAVVRQTGRSVVAIDAFGEAPDAFTPIGDRGLCVNGLDIDDLVARIPGDVDLIGVSCMFSNEWPYHRRVINAIARRFPDTPIVLGGEHVSADPDYCFSCCPDILACVIGEGEDTLVDLIAALESGRDLTDVPGLALRIDDGGVHRTTKRSRRRALSGLPWPDWDGMPIENYLSRGIGHGVARVRSLPLLASRGCPFQCAFCSSPQMWGTRWDIRDVEDVVAEMKSLVATYRVNSFSFYDLTAIIRKDWILAFANRLIEERLNVTWNLPSG
ncbi:MAG: B12-binding domain-containing radical SAM protein, partial [Phycisphaerales bacterium]|nr:B12-binding domain-containing radical SAM protein [Phycisphaerales bacterium]